MKDRTFRKEPEPHQRRIPEWLFSTFYGELVEYPSVGGSAKLSSGYESIRLKREDLQEISDLVGHNEPTTFQKLMDEGAEGMGLRFQGQLVAMTWIDRNEIKMPLWNLPLPEDAVCLMYQFVDPLHRGRGLAGSLFSMCIENLRKGGYKKFVGVIERSNTASFRVKNKLKARCLKRIYVYRFFNLRPFVFLRSPGAG